MRIEVIHGSILRQADAEAIVCCAPPGPSFRDRTDPILLAAGPGLLRHGQIPGVLDSERTVITPGFSLPNPWLIHMRVKGHGDDPELALQCALEAVLELAHNQLLRSMVMPNWRALSKVLPHRLLARATAQVLCHAETTAPYLRWIRLCVDDAVLLPIYTAAFDEIPQGVS